jgi:hypothetical protein
MAQNFIGCDRDQSFLMPPDVRDWLPEGHLAWFVLDAVAGMDLSAFYAAYRAEGVGRRAALGELFGQVLGLCAQAGLVRPGVVAVDGTRMAGNASRESTLEFGQIAREILAEAKAVDEAEDELYGQARGDELPEQLRTREGRPSSSVALASNASAKRPAIRRRIVRSPSPRRPPRWLMSSRRSGSSRVSRGGRVGQRAASVAVRRTNLAGAPRTCRLASSQPVHRFRSGFPGRSKQVLRW